MSEVIPWVWQAICDTGIFLIKVAAGLAISYIACRICSKAIAKSLVEELKSLTKQEGDES